MQNEITDDAAIEFSRDFDEAIASGIAVDEALAEARKGVALAIPGTPNGGRPSCSCGPLTACCSTSRRLGTPSSPPRAPRQSMQCRRSRHPCRLHRRLADPRHRPSRPPHLEVRQRPPVTPLRRGRCLKRQRPLGPRRNWRCRRLHTRFTGGRLLPRSRPPQGSSHLPWWYDRVDGRRFAGDARLERQRRTSGRTTRSWRFGSRGSPEEGHHPRRSSDPVRGLRPRDIRGGGPGRPQPKRVRTGFRWERGDRRRIARRHRKTIADGRQAGTNANGGYERTLADREAVGPGAAFPSGILFANDAGELSDIMFVDPSGNNLRPVLPGPTDDSWPKSWSPRPHPHRLHAHHGWSWRDLADRFQWQRDPVLDERRR